LIDYNQTAQSGNTLLDVHTMVNSNCSIWMELCNSEQKLPAISENRPFGP